MTQEFSIGCNGRGAIHTEPLSVDDQFRLVKESGVFDHFDRMPQPGEEKEYLDAVQKHALPLTTGLWSYTIGQDEAVIERNLRLCKEAGSECHNLMIVTRHAEGHVVTDQEVVDFYKLAYELSQKIGITIGFEVHIYMWSEDLRRVTPVAEMIKATPVDGFVGCGMAIDAMDHGDLLPKITTPTLVLVGADDPATTVEHSKVIHDAVSGSEMVVLDDAAHLSNIEQSDAFNTAVLAHFGKH